MAIYCSVQLFFLAKLVMTQVGFFHMHMKRHSVVHSQGADRGRRHDNNLSVKSNSFKVFVLKWRKCESLGVYGTFYPL